MNTSKTNTWFVARAWNSMRNRISEHRQLAELEAMPYSLRKDIGFKAI